MCSLVTIDINLLFLSPQFCPSQPMVLTLTVLAPDPIIGEITILIISNFICYTLRVSLFPSLKHQGYNDKKKKKKKPDLYSTAAGERSKSWLFNLWFPALTKRTFYSQPPTHLPGVLFSTFHLCPFPNPAYPNQGLSWPSKCSTREPGVPHSSYCTPAAGEPASALPLNGNFIIVHIMWTGRWGVGRGAYSHLKNAITPGVIQ